LDLNGDWNIEKLPHQGRHPNDYHRWVLNVTLEIDAIPGMNQNDFIKLFRERIIQPIKINPDMLYKKYWRQYLK
jgi:hypothetical protein